MTNNKIACVFKTELLVTATHLHVSINTPFSTLHIYVAFYSKHFVLSSSINSKNHQPKQISTDPSIQNLQFGLLPPRNVVVQRLSCCTENSGWSSYTLRERYQLFYLPKRQRMSITLEQILKQNKPCSFVRQWHVNTSFESSQHRFIQIPWTVGASQYQNMLFITAVFVSIALYSIYLNHEFYF